jgi:DNA-binding MarR family transcriptional regulator
VTRGAIQQTVDRLVKKGMVEKFMDESDRKKVYLELTEKGNTAFDGHEAYHAELSSRLGKCFEGLRPGEVASLRNLLDEVESAMHGYREQKPRQKRRSG